MQKRRLGQTDIEVSCLGLGTVKFGRNQGVKYPAAFALPSENDIKNLLAETADLGINLLDTAPAYGSSEERLGRCLIGRREDWVIATKVGETFVDGESTYDFAPALVTDSVERSLIRLRTDYLDIVLVHSNGDDERIIQEDHVFDTLETLKQAGKIRAYGMSTKTVTGGLLTLEQADVAMVALHPAYQDEMDVITHAHQKQKGIFIKKALASGHLQTVGSPTCALQFAVSQPGVTSVIIGTLNAAHLRENVQAINAISA